MKTYNHAFDFAFEVISATPDGSDVTPAMLRVALVARASRITDEELRDACNRFDTMDNDDGLEPS